ncbi:unnamed protein product [Ranitomeya imitator]|uniref:SOS1/NGEF-like PH domain-containing protein n=1 Tax=Ranitomeya imitator TaxID=111125 RepID=A0ABN9LGL6_9NEOB|nr:unnamed protein product [Ranitomeya imitator]
MAHTNHVIAPSDLNVTARGCGRHSAAVESGQISCLGIEDSVDNDPSKFALTSRGTDRSLMRYTLQASSADIRMAWVRDIGQILESQRNFLNGKVVLGQVLFLVAKVLSYFYRYEDIVLPSSCSAQVHIAEQVLHTLDEVRALKRSLANKMDTLELMVLEHNYDMVGISETWLDESHDWAVNLQGYSLFRNDRTDKRGRESPKIMEATENILIKQIDEAATQGEVIIMGDFNYPEIDWGTETCSSSKALQSPIEYQRRESKSNSLGRSSNSSMMDTSRGGLRPHSSASMDRNKVPNLKSYNSSLPSLYLPSNPRESRLGSKVGLKVL